MQDADVDPLAQLRDIHLPDAVSWWPPAPGWWLVAGVAGLVLVVLGWWLQKRRRSQQLLQWQRRGQRLALQELERLRREQLTSPETLVGELSVLLRRVAILHYPASNCAALLGQEWLQFLDRTLGAGADGGEGFEANPFSAGVGRCLADTPYQPPGRTPVDSAALLDLAQRWLEGLPLLAENSSAGTRRR
ncbi:MAG: DUF4381 domain-containing protein [Desulfuromonas sp.]